MFYVLLDKGCSVQYRLGVREEKSRHPPTRERDPDNGGHLKPSKIRYEQYGCSYF